MRCLSLSCLDMDGVTAEPPSGWPPLGPWLPSSSSSSSSSSSPPSCAAPGKRPWGRGGALVADGAPTAAMTSGASALTVTPGFDPAGTAASAPSRLGCGRRSPFSSSGEMAADCPSIAAFMAFSPAAHCTAVKGRRPHESRRPSAGRGRRARTRKQASRSSSTCSFTLAMSLGPRDSMASSVESRRTKASGVVIVRGWLHRYGQPGMRALAGAVRGLPSFAERGPGWRQARTNHQAGKEKKDELFIFPPCPFERQSRPPDRAALPRRPHHVGRQPGDNKRL